MNLSFRKSFPLFWQAESTDCGPACLQMICHFYGKKHSQQFIKDNIDISRIGITVGDILRRSKELGFDSIVAKININQLIKVKIPVILHWKSIHFVVLYKIKKTREGFVFCIADPSNGKISHWRLLKSVNAKLLNSVFMLVTRFSGLQTLSHFSNDYIGVGALKLGSPIFHECRTIHFQPDC